MLPPEYVHLIVEEHQRHLRTLSRPFGLATTIYTVRLRLADALVSLGTTLTIPDAAVSSRPPSIARTPPQ